MEKTGRNIRNYVIIDDLPESQFFEEQHPHLLRVEQDKGFAEPEAMERAEEVWEEGDS